ncbi:hypothetical protein NLX86_19060 [Streptomyces sp. A3M-1-3]|uniref:hypothetical protein n=1 Tax=Streptomyces sp. A3M-1-3 TaxID=2962044 RepID=UPI0020B87295|nr:hypothetical protein [Streptomyces sp. A3M-1-3]MCP3820119.1 hypothetical protein [Streptomyces sp. A3M-1-3]
MTSARNFLGIPVEGDINEGDKRKKQRPLEEFQPILQAVLDDPTITEFGWRQYTPYFNDGDPCTFSAYETWVRTTTDGEDVDGYELEVAYSHPSLGQMTGGEWVDNPEDPGGRRIKVGERYEGSDQARYERARELDRAIEGGQYLDVLLDAFGDHANITVRRSGIQVEFYQHD